MIRALLIRTCVPLVAIAVLCCVGLPSEALATPKGQSPWSDQTNSKVRIVSGTLSEDGKANLYAGVQIRMAPGWKTYWRNPGDSGVPPSFDWTGSKNVKHAEVMYPVPHRFADANGTAIGYDEEILFPVRITRKDDSQPVELSLTLDYGLCKELCIPNSVELHATLPADLGKGDAVLIQQARARVPLPAGDGVLPRIAGLSAELDGKTATIIVEAEFEKGATDTDLFVASTEVAIPVPKAQGPVKDGKQRFSVVLPSAEEAAAVKGKPLTFTLVSNRGSTETTRTLP